MTSKKNKEDGVALVEIAVSLPVVLALIFIGIWVSVTWTSKTSLDEAIGEGLRLGMTRGELRNASINLPLEVMLASEDKRDPGMQFPGYYDAMSNEIFGRSFLALPESYRYALAYTSWLAKERMGSGVRYPCDPEGSGDENGPRCMECRFLNPDTLESEPYVSAADPTNYLDPPARLAIQCNYQPSILLVSAIVNLLAKSPVNTPKILIKQKKSIDWTSTS